MNNSSNPAHSANYQFISPAWFIAIYQLANFMAFSVYGRDIFIIRFAREPLLVLLLVILFWKGNEVNRFEGNGIKIIIALFSIFVVYSFFNTLLGLAPLVSILYFLWLFAAMLFFWKLIWAHPGHINLKQLLYDTARKLFYLNSALILISYVGGYLLGIEDYFDLRYNDFTGEFLVEFGGIFASTNAFGILLFQTICLGIIASIDKNGIQKFFFLFSTLVFSFLLFQVNNRSSILCLVIFALLIFVLYYKFYISTIVFVVALTIYFVFNPDYLNNKLRLNQFEGERKFGNRTELIREGVFLAEEMDFFGVGYFNQRTARRAFGIATESDPDMSLHNTYLAMLVELGYFGFFVFLGSVLFILGRGIWSVSLKNNKSIAILLVSVIASIMLFHSTVEDSFNFPGSPTFNFVWFFLLTLLAISEEPEESLV